MHGSAVPPGHSVCVAGRAVPVDANGNFVAQEILPSGMHTVEVAVLDQQGNGNLYLRDIELERNDWFYVGMADLTLTSNDTNGPIELLQGENAPYDFDSSADARLAFFVNGKFNEGWRLTASADTRDEPLERSVQQLPRTSRRTRCSAASIPTTTSRRSATTAPSRRWRRRSASST